MVMKESRKKVAPNHYTPVDREGFQIDPKQIHFPIYKNIKTNVFAEHSKRKEWVPSPNTYSPTRK